MSHTNGKGDAPKSCFSKEFKENYDFIFKKNNEKQNKLKALNKQLYPIKTNEK